MLKKFDFIVLGATGIQGKIVSKDLLLNKYAVLLCGRDKIRVNYLLKKFKNSAFEYFDAKDINRTAKIIKNSGANIVINCVEGDWNLHILKAAIKAGVHSLDLGSEIWMTKEQLKLDSFLKEKNLTSITGCGSVPGIGNVMLNYAAKKFDSIGDIDVGFAWNSNIKKFVVPFSIMSIIEEFTEPATILEQGRFIKKIPLNSIILNHHQEVGEQKEFLVRHPEVYTFYHYFKQKGLKNIKFYASFPKHSFKVIMSIIDMGMGSKEEILYQRVKVKPIEFVAEILKKIKIPKGYEEKENLWVKIKGEKEKQPQEILMECIVPTIKGWEDAGCNIDTGLPVSIIAQMIKKQIIKERGSFAPEGIIPPDLFFKELRKKKMLVLENGKNIN